MDYRTAATNNNGGVFLRFPAPATVADIDRGGYQVAILDNGGATTRTGAITQERGPATTFAAPTAPTSTYKPTREWNTLTIKAVRSHIQVWVNGVPASSYDDATRNGRAGYIGLENAGNNLMYRSVRVRELAPDTVAPTVTVADIPAKLALGAPVPATFSCADESELASCVATLDGKPIAAGDPLNAVPGPHTLVVTATDAEGHVTTRTIAFDVVAQVTGTVGGAVPATLALTLGTPAGFEAFTPGVAKEYTAATTATVVSTAGDAALSVADPSTTATGHLVNGAFSLPSALQAQAGGAFAPVGGTAAPTALRSWTAPASNDAVTVTFKQAIAAADALRTGTYAKTLTFTLATTAP